MKNFIEDSAEQIMLNSMSNVFMSEKLDPVGKEDSDIDNDGDSDKSDSYLRKRRQAVGAAIAAEKSKRVKKEELELSLRQKVEGLNEKKLYPADKATTSDEKEITIEEKPVKNIIKINPDIQEGLKQARKNVGAGKCWDGYVAKGTKKKDGKEVPNCVKEWDEVESVDEGLSGERYKKALKKGKMYSRMVSKDPSKRAKRGGRGGESDFGAGDRGSGNKAARRAGTYQEEEFQIDETRRGAPAAGKEKTLSEKAVSRKQQRFMGMVRAAQKGEGAASPEVAKVAASMKKKDVKDFASTKHAKLPEKKSVKEEIAAIAEGARKPEVEEKGKKVAEYERAGKYQGITSKFRKENPGSREEKKERGRKQTEGELNQERIKKHNERVRKHGFTSKEKKESKAREKYDSARD